MKKLTKKQNKLWNKAKLYHALRDLPDAPPCCYNCRHRLDFAEDCLFKKEIDFYVIFSRSTGGSAAMSLLPEKTICELKVSLCNNFFDNNDKTSII